MALIPAPPAPSKWTLSAIPGTRRGEAELVGFAPVNEMFFDLVSRTALSHQIGPRHSSLGLFSIEKNMLHVLKYAHELPPYGCLDR